MIRQRYAHPSFPLVPLGSLTTLIQYGTSIRSTSEPTGVPILRIPNLQADGWDLSDLKYQELSAEELATYRLEKGDILFNRTNGSRELVGKSEVFDFEGDWAFASYLIRLRVDRERVMPEFVTAFLNTLWGRRQVEHVSRQILMSNINAQEIRALQIPLPNLPTQKALLNTLDGARRARTALRADAEALLASIDPFVLGRLGIVLPPAKDAVPFAVRLADVTTRLDPAFYSARFKVLREKIANGLQPAPSVRSLCDFIRSGFAAGANRQTDDATLGIPHIRPLNITNDSELRFDNTKMVPRADVSDEDIIRRGEVLFNNTNSTAWVGKSVVFDVARECACSNHITRLRLARGRGNPYFLAAVLNALRRVGFFGLLATNFNNQAGVNTETLENVLLPWPDTGAQLEIANEVGRRRAEARRMRAEADKLWQETQTNFEKRLLGPRT